MCMHQKLSCVCGKKLAYIFHRDDILPEEVIMNIHCPECRNRAGFSKSTMIEDVGWIIEYDMEAAVFYLRASGVSDSITPDFIFDNDYCSWYGVSPTDLDENARVHKELLPLQKTDKLLYFNKLKQTRMAHFEELKKAGWRKAQKV
ncbi:MAG: hypothetical protein GY795_07900 [Desulfobacterales bacterium]|nr:hypothetical protein [Desulfobacterales bacterium]